MRFWWLGVCSYLVGKSRYIEVGIGAFSSIGDSDVTRDTGMETLFANTCFSVEYFANLVSLIYIEAQRVEAACNKG